MSVWTILIQGFEYDLWANRQWMECLLGKQNPSPDVEILRHILSAQEIWLHRVNGQSLSKLPEIELSDDEVARLNKSWTEVLASAVDDRQIDFRRTTGEQQCLSLSEIARHVANHGTYHRGELRGLCLSRNDDDFPETDFSRFAVASQRR
jgi:uncharacterized damage-inducible protein DinB